jgi:hypothetical protein
MGKHTLRVETLKLVACCDDAFATQAESMLEAVASFRDKGRGLGDGVTVQFGWSLLTLRQRGDELIVCEPDFDSDPLTRIREDVTCTLAVLTGQAAVINLLGVEPEEVHFNDWVLVYRGCLDEQRVFLYRHEREPEVSGWSVDPVDSPLPEVKEENFEFLRVFELLSRRPELLKVMGLPEGYMVFFKGDRIDAVFDENERDVWEASKGR